MRMWNLQYKYEEAIFENHTENITGLAITSDNKFIVSCSYDKTVRVWNLQNKNQEAVLEGHAGGVALRLHRKQTSNLL